MSEAQFISEIMKIICDEKGQFVLSPMQLQNIASKFLDAEIKK